MLQKYFLDFLNQSLIELSANLKVKVSKLVSYTVAVTEPITLSKSIIVVRGNLPPRQFLHHDLLDVVSQRDVLKLPT